MLGGGSWLLGKCHAGHAGQMTHILAKIHQCDASELLRCLFVLGLIVWNGDNYSFLTSFVFSQRRCGKILLPLLFQAPPPL